VKVKNLNDETGFGQLDKITTMFLSH